MLKRIPLLSVLAAVFLAISTSCTPQAVEPGNNTHQNNQPKTVAVTSVSLNKTDLILTEGGSEMLTATVKPDDATDKTVTWSTSDATVATVENGKVTALKAGSAVITAKAGDKTATCKVTVNAKVIAVTSITLSKPELVLTEGESETLTATVKPDDATNKSVTWSTSDATVATVENGKVTALKAGSAVITAKAGEQSTTCSVTVKEPDRPEGFNDEHRNW